MITALQNNPHSKINIQNSVLQITMNRNDCLCYPLAHQTTYRVLQSSGSVHLSGCPYACLSIQTFYQHNISYKHGWRLGVCHIHMPLEPRNLLNGSDIHSLLLSKWRKTYTFSEDASTQYFIKAWGNKVAYHLIMPIRVAKKSLSRGSKLVLFLLLSK